MEDLVGPTLKSKTGTISTDQVKADNQVIALYFSAHWCPPCRAFTPVLADFYNEVNAGGKKLEIIFVSCDKSEAEFNEYYGTMPWVSVPHGDPRAHAIMNKFQIQGVPHLMVINKDGTTAIANARGDVQTQGPGIISEWISRVH